MDAKDKELFSSTIEKFLESDGSVASAAKILGPEVGKGNVESALADMFATIDAAIGLERDIEERGEEQAFGDSERASTDAGKEEVAAATAEALNALSEEV